MNKLSHASSQRGSLAIELALIVPLCALLVLHAFSVVRQLSIYQTGYKATHNAARYMASLSYAENTWMHDFGGIDHGWVATRRMRQEIFASDIAGLGIARNDGHSGMHCEGAWDLCGSTRTQQIIGARFHLYAAFYSYSLPTDKARGNFCNLVYRVSGVQYCDTTPGFGKIGADVPHVTHDSPKLNPKYQHFLFR